MLDRHETRITALEAGFSNEPTFPTLAGTPYLRWRFRESDVVQSLGRVSQVLDSSGNGRNSNVAAGLARPKWRPKHFNGGFPAVYFNGTSTKLTYTIPANVAPPISIVSIIQDYKNGTGNCNIVNSGFAVFSNGTTGDWRSFNGTVLTLVGSAAANEITPLFLGHTRHPAVRMDIFNGASSMICNNDTETTGAAGTTSPILVSGGTLTVGDDGAGTGWMRGFLAELYIHVGAFSAGERDALRAYYQELYGISAVT